MQPRSSSSALFTLLELQTNRNGIETKREVMLKEDDTLKAATVVLPAANFAISKARELFSGEPSITLKNKSIILLKLFHFSLHYASLLLLGSEYGHIVTFKRLCALDKINYNMVLTHIMLSTSVSIQFVFASFRVLYRIYWPKTVLFILEANMQERPESADIGKWKAWGGCSHKKIENSCSISNHSLLESDFNQDPHFC
ncbi:hypothetical protein Tco_0322044, partial [Tanacetum coccineum]